MIRRIAICLSMTVLTGCFDGSNAPQASAPNPPERPSVAAPPAVVYKSLREAIDGTTHLMTDTVNELSPGAVLLALWSAEHLEWKELQNLPATKVSLVMKDSDEQRGKGLCTTGSVIEIAAEKAASQKFFHGGLFDNAGNIFRFVAVKSTGELVASSRATFCGVVIGKQDYSNSMGGAAHAVFLVGMFKLPENGAHP